MISFTSINAPKQAWSEATPAELARANQQATKGVAAYRAGDYAVAARSFRLALRSLDNAIIRWNYARSLERLGKLNRAKEVFRDVLVRDAVPKAVRRRGGDDLVRVVLAIRERHEAEQRVAREAALQEELATLRKSVRVSSGSDQVSIAKARQRIAQIAWLKSQLVEERRAAAERLLRLKSAQVRKIVSLRRQLAKERDESRVADLKLRIQDLENARDAALNRLSGERKRLLAELKRTRRDLEFARSADDSAREAVLNRRLYKLQILEREIGVQINPKGELDRDSVGSPTNMTRKVGWALVGVGAAALVGGIVTYAVAAGDSDDLQLELAPETDGKIHAMPYDTAVAKRREIESNLRVGGGIAAMGVAVAFIGTVYLTLTKGTSAVAIGPAGRGVEFVARW